MFTKEMQKALEADGEKLLALTGEDHGPIFPADAELRAENERLRGEVAEWKERYEAERQDHEATIKHCDEMLRADD